MNADWHRAHMLGRAATWDERVAWHDEHARECACRAMPDDIRAELARRAAETPASPAGRREL